MNINMDDPTFGNISDTACWVAALRGLEMERVDAAFHDPLSRKLAGRRGQEMIDKMPGGKSAAWAISLRTRAIDDLILNTLAKDSSIDKVLNLAAGLDCRPYRLNLPSGLRWIEVDLPDVISYKTHKLENEIPRCQLKRIALDLRELEKRRILFKEISTASKSVLVITEGLLMYLNEQSVVDLSKDLIQPNFHWWAQDIHSDKVMVWMKYGYNRELKKLNAPFQFGPPGGPEYYEKLGWKISKYNSIYDQAKISGRASFPLGLWSRVVQYCPKRVKNYFDNLSGFLLLNR